ncbi:MAG: hypothetical protein JWQ35_715 [Bacteriovoracaceae bacterium]|nr:hypothetical protein [Bacteriovoracaceae bacterium]
MRQKVIKHNYQVLAHLLKNIVAERFKRMAKDDVLFKFISNRIDPALLVDHNIQAEREAMDLAEMSLLKLVDSEHIDIELKKSADKIQKNFQRMFGENASKEYLTKPLIESRVSWLSSRVDFYRRMLSLAEEVESPLELGSKAFRSLRNFNRCLRPITDADRKFADAIVQSTAALNRFLMRKHMDYELKNSEVIWNDYAGEVFRKSPELTE